MIPKWKNISFPDCLIVNTVNRLNQINASEIKTLGKYPVIDQGQDFIAGYSDDETRVVKQDLPHIIFGDHTRCFKYIDFPYIIGADGTKVLSPNKKLFEPRFFYYQLLTLDIPSRGYNRHFKELKEKELICPSLPEQFKITYILSTIQKAIEQQDKLIHTATELKKALIQKLFTEGIKGEKQKQTEIGLVPQSWNLLKIADVVKIQGGYAFKSEEGILSSKTQLVRMGNLYQNKLDLSRAPIFYPDNYQDLFPNFLLSEGDLIMSLTGTMGKEDYGFTVRVPKTEKALLLNQRVARFEITDDNIDKEYLRHYFLSRPFLNKLYKTAKGTKQANLSSNEIKNLHLPTPKNEEQKEISLVLNCIEDKIESHNQKKIILSDFFKTLLNELMTGERRVHNIDFETMNEE
jgi:type I restriction enzyme, S subunit